jgi:hypothetical protein
MGKETGDPKQDATPIGDKAAQEYREKHGVGPEAHARHLKVDINERNAKLNRY